MSKSKIILYTTIICLIHALVFQINVNKKVITPTQKKEQKEEQNLAKFFQQVTINSGNCLKHYFGVGLMYSKIDDIITDISPNSPAEKEGLKVGDHILKMIEPDDISDWFWIRVSRNGGELAFRMKPARICHN